MNTVAQKMPEEKIDALEGELKSERARVHQRELLPRKHRITDHSLSKHRPHMAS